MAHVITKFSRPSPSVINKFSRISAATVYMAAGNKGSVDAAIKPVARGFRICGPAFTVQCAPNDNLMLHKALEKAQAGDVLVATVGDYWNAGYWGDMMTISAKARKLEGLAIDGCVRDSAEIIASKFPVFCRGFCIRSTSKKHLGLINHPLILGNVLVNPGDLVLGDDDGMVVIDRSECETILDKAIKKVATEEKNAALLKTGQTSVQLNALDGMFESLGLVEE